MRVSAISMPLQKLRDEALVVAVCSDAQIRALLNTADVVEVVVAGLEVVDVELVPLATNHLAIVEVDVDEVMIDLDEKRLRARVVEEEVGAFLVVFARWFFYIYEGVEMEGSKRLSHLPRRRRDHHEPVGAGEREAR